MRSKAKKITVCLLGTLYFVVSTLNTFSQYRLHISYADKDTAFNPAALKLQTDFTGQMECLQYIDKLPALLSSKGYPTASVDTIAFDTTFASIRLYTGRQYQWVQLQTGSIEKQALEQGGFFAKDFSGKALNINLLQGVQQRILTYYEKTGYPFASVYLDSIRIQDDNMKAVLQANKGPLYHIDSIRMIGKAKLSNYFLQRYLNIANGSIYNREKLQKVDRLILELPYVEAQQASDLTMLGSGSVLNLYLAPKRSSQVNFLVGFLPATTATGKLQLTGDVNLNLKNMFGTGETLLLNWQQLQQQSPRLNLGYQKPYLFRSPFGIDFSFELFKKDSAFLQLNALLGVQYVLSSNQSGKLFVQNQRTFLLASGADTNQVRATRRLPPNIDVSTISLGLDYEWYNTNYRRNPRSGNEIRVTVSSGIKKIDKSNDILNLKDPSFNYASLYDSIKLRTYQLRVKLSAAHYFPLSKQSVFKTAFNGGLFASQGIFRNELFQIGGYRLLRGFDEESIYATQYGVFTAEYRNIISLNSYLFTFADAGLVRSKYQSVDVKTNFISAGLGIAFETKFGLLNISYAMGKRGDVPFNLRQASKIHFGYVNYF
jgi:outer membrane protein assembly factor BamA